MNFHKLSLWAMPVSALSIFSTGGNDTEVKSKKDEVSSERPNIILIMADDLGYGDLGCFGNKFIKTPVLDQMAMEGMRFTDFHSNGAVCTPTRAALITGNYQQRAGLEGVIYVNERDYGLSPDQTTLAKVFRENGYATGLFGKWHLGFIDESHPNNHGFDEFYGFISGNVDYISHRDNLNIHDWWHNRELVYHEGYATDLITDYSLKFIQMNLEKPFFLFISHLSPHFPFQGPGDGAERLPGKEFIAHGSRPDREQAYKEMIESLDMNIGRVFQYLEENNLKNNTLVFFCSDNGPLMPPGSAGILRGKKSEFFEGGHRVPAIVRFPGQVKPGTISNELILTMDLFPTFLSVAGIKEKPKTDGIDFSKVVKGRKLSQRTVFWRRDDSSAVRRRKWKYMELKGKKFLFNLNRDISEQNNLVERNRRRAGQMAEELKKWESEMDKYPQNTRVLR